MQDVRVSQRWLDLAADALTPASDPVQWPRVVRALVEDFGSALAVVERDAQRGLLSPVRDRSAGVLALDSYRCHAGDLPLLRHLADAAHVPHRVCLHPFAPPAGQRAPRDDGLRHALSLPLRPAAAGPGRWLVLARAEPYTRDDQTLGQHLQSLVAALEQHVAPPVAVVVPAPRETVPRLTARERTVLALLAEGLVTDAIGHRLGVSGRTVAKHQEHIYRKFGTSDRLTAVLRAQAAGLLPALEERARSADRALT